MSKVTIQASIINADPTKLAFDGKTLTFDGAPFFVQFGTFDELFQSTSGLVYYDSAQNKFVQVATTATDFYHAAGNKTTGRFYIKARFRRNSTLDEQISNFYTNVAHVVEKYPKTKGQVKSPVYRGASEDSDFDPELKLTVWWNLVTPTGERLTDTDPQLTAKLATAGIELSSDVIEATAPEVGFNAAAALEELQSPTMGIVIIDPTPWLGRDATFPTKLRTWVKVGEAAMNEAAPKRRKIAVDPNFFGGGVEVGAGK